MMGAAATWHSAQYLALALSKWLRLLWAKCVCLAGTNHKAQLAVLLLVLACACAAYYLIAELLSFGLMADG